MQDVSDKTQFFGLGYNYNSPYYHRPMQHKSACNSLTCKAKVNKLLCFVYFYCIGLPMLHLVNDNESQLVTLAAGGNRQAFAALYNTYLDELYHYIFLFTHSKEETEEIVQEVFVKLWENRSKLEGINNFKHYLFRSAKNKLLDEVRKLQIRHRVLSELKRSTVIGERSTDNQLVYKEYYRIVQEAIEQLPAKRKLIFRLNTENGFSHDEIANQLHISKSVVKKQLYLAYDFVKDYLKTHGGLSYTIITMLAIIGG